MKPILSTLILLVALALPGCSEQTEPLKQTNAGNQSGSIEALADRVADEGEDVSMNVGFARLLGFQVDQPLQLKRLQFEQDGVTHRFDLLLDDHSNIILTEQRRSLSTFYLADQQGNLLRAIVNDGTIANGGLTNLTQEEAASGFTAQRELWLERDF